jgi:LuxR family maltose regulon positive regulatory protein
LRPPHVTSALVLRPRLLAQLTRGVRRTPVTLLSGPAGSGKTVLAASWVREQPVDAPISWITMDESDEDPATFWTYVREGLSQAGVDVSGTEPLVPGERVPDSFVPRLIAGVLDLPRPMVLVVDNADRLSGAARTAGLDPLVQHGGARLRLVLCARADPPLPLHRYRLSDMVTEIRSGDLAFTAEEAGELLARLGAPVSPEVAAALQAETEGWAVGLRLAAAPLKEGSDPAELVSALAQDDGSVAQYLVAELLASQPASVRRFLLRASVATELEPDLVDRLARHGRSRHLLTSLAHANAFVEHTGDGQFRIHPLFREMLRAQLRYERPEDFATLNGICAAWYAERGRTREAVGHAVTAGDWDLAASLLVDDLLVSRLLAHGVDPALRSLDALPGDVPGPAPAVVRAAAALSRGRRPDPADLARAEAAGRDATNGLPLRVSAAVAWAVAAAEGAGESDDVLRAVADAADLVALLPDEQRAARRELSALLAVARATVLVRSQAADGELLDALEAALMAGEGIGSRRLRCRCAADLALVEALQGHLRRAAELVARVEGLCPDRTDLPAEAAIAAAWVGVDRNENDEARRWMVRAQTLGTGEGVQVTAPLLAVLSSRLLRLRHEVESAERALRPFTEDAGLPRWVREQVVTEQVRVSLARDEAAAGLRLLSLLGDTPRCTLLLARAEVLGLRDVPRGEPAPDGADLPLAVAVESEVVRACAHASDGAGSAAVATLEHALRIAAPEGLRWPFLDSPPQVRRLLRAHPRLAEAGAWLSPSRAPAPTGRSLPEQGRMAAAPIPQELSEREREVLRHLAEMLSTAEIAATMFVSVNTVRTHIRSILRKLSVGRRNQAVRRARELDLI